MEALAFRSAEKMYPLIEGLSPGKAPNHRDRSSDAVIGRSVPMPGTEFVLTGGILNERTKYSTMNGEKPAKIALPPGRLTPYYPLATDHNPLLGRNSWRIMKIPVTFFGSRSCRKNLRNSMILRNRRGRGATSFKFRVGVGARREKTWWGRFGHSDTARNLKLELET